MELVILGENLKEFKNAITSLTKFGEEIDISASKECFRISSVNSSRSAFGVITFEPSFFEEYSILEFRDDNEEVEQAEESKTISFNVTGKALLSPLKSRSNNSVESCSLTLTDDDPSAILEDGQEGGECRLVIRLHCQHGVIKTHRLTYGKSASLFAKVDRARCTSFWEASSRVLKDWTEHFHLQMNASTGGTEEISFHLEAYRLAIKSFSSSFAIEDALVARPLTTELQVDVEDFDNYQVVNTPIITFGLKEFKAIIALAEGSSLTAAFSEGGSPMVMEIRTESFNADFVIATTDFDSHLGNEEDEQSSRDANVKRERSASHQKRLGSTTVSKSSSKGKVKEKEKAKVPLFRAISQSVDRGDGQDDDQDEEDEFGMIEFGDDDLAAIDALSQVPPNSQRQHGIEVIVIDDDDDDNEFDQLDDHQMKEEEEEEEEEKKEVKLLGPTQVKKNERWNLSPEIERKPNK